MGEADVVLGCDLIVTTSNEALSKIKAGVTKAVVNSAESPTADFVRNPNWQFGSPNLATQIREAVGAQENAGECAFVDASALATALMGDSIYTNPLVLGYAWQKGWIPLAYETLQRAIEINAVAVDANKKAFEWGRAAAHDVEMVKRIAFPDNVVELKRVANTLDEIVAKRVEFPDRLPERGLCKALCRLGRTRAQGRIGPSAVDPRHRSGGALLLQAARVQGRVRSRPAAFRSGVPRQDRRAVRRRLQAEFLHGAADYFEARSGQRKGRRRSASALG